MEQPSSQGATSADAASATPGEVTETGAANALPSSAGRTLEDPLAEALRLIALATQQGLQVRLMGGLAFHARVPDWTAQISRARRDIDLTTTSRDRKAVSELLAREGYLGDRQYNALYGHKQLYFVDPARGRPVDVLVDKLEMCHRFDFGDRLAVSQQTLPLAELLLSKLQVVKMNRKDALDALILLAEHRLAPGDQVDGVDTISVNRIVALTSADWGWWRTLTMNLDKLAEIWRSDVQPDELAVGRPHLFDVATQIDAMRTAIDEAPKSTRWKFRSRLGDRVAWYQEPEEVGHGPG